MNSLELSQIPILDLDKNPITVHHNYDLEDLLQTIGNVLKINPKWIIAQGRQPYLTDARQLFCFFASKLTNCTPKLIGQTILRDRTTVLYSIKKIEDLLYANDVPITEKYLLIKRALNL